MSTQITIRLDDEVVAFIDRLVSEGREKSRASAITRALRRAQQEEVAARDARILASTPQDDDMSDFLAWSAKHHVAVD